MKKPLTIFFITAVLLSVITAVNISAADKPVLTPEYLASNTWGPFMNSVKARFTKDEKFDMTFVCDNHCELMVQGSGKYSIKGDRVTLTFDSFPQCHTFKKGESVVGRLTDESSFKYRWYLSFDKYMDQSINLYNHNSLIKDGEALSLNNVEAVSTGEREGVTTAVLKVRESPNVSGKEKIFDCEKTNGDTVTIKALDKGKQLKIFARTKEKDKVGKWNNYWYYVSFIASESCPEGATGWVFGEFVKIK